jgi:hypothetical protein
MNNTETLDNVGYTKTQDNVGYTKTQDEDNVGYTKTQDEHKHNTKTQHNIENLKDEQHGPYQIGKLVN